MTSLPLHEFHQAAGAVFGEVNGQEVVAHYGDWLAEYTALREGAAVLDLSFRGRLCVLGADAQRFLNGQVTNNVKDLQIGEGCYAALVSAKGKLQSDLNIYRLENEMLLDFEPGLAESVTQRLEKFVIAEDVQVIDAAAQYGLLSLQGPKVAEVLGVLWPRFTVPSKAMGWTKFEEPAFGEIYVAAKGGGLDLFVPADGMQDIASRLQAQGGRLCGCQALETARIEDGLPRFGADMDETNLAPEALDTRAISYSKGCYIGQEVIARIRTYGQVAKSLRGLRLGGESQQPPGRGAKLFLGEKEVGSITSVAWSPALRANIALGYVRREANQTGTELEVQTSGGKIPARIVDLPFAL
ncbi:MAG TPA: aminomethyltransferase family protein [Verrucomicrobiae bacterium]|nr:aminomethyltransferase family protein [Verrucomicrobiae bacterium]